MSCLKISFKTTPTNSNECKLMSRYTVAPVIVAMAYLVVGTKRHHWDEPSGSRRTIQGCLSWECS